MYNKEMRFWLTSFLIIGLITLATWAYKPNKAEAAWYKTGGTWTYRKSITIDYTKVPDTDSSNGETNFPVLMDFTDTDFKDAGNGGGVAQTDGGDILFTSSNGTTKLSHEIEVYTNTTGRLTAWVNVPSLSSAANTVIYVYYGNASADNQWDAPDGSNDVWDSYYSGVWHLKDGATLDLTDSSDTNNDFTNNSAVAAAAGKIDGAASSGGSTAWASKSSASDTLFNTGDQITIETWFKRSSASNAWNPIITMGGNKEGGANRNFELTFAGSITVVNSLSFLYYNGSTWQAFSSDNAVTDTTNFHHYTFTYTYGTANTAKFYVDGELDTTGAWRSGTGSEIPVTAGISTLYLFASTDGSEYGNGTGDELRISKGISRSADWIKTSFNNQSATSTFYTLEGTAETEPPVGGGIGQTPTVKVSGGVKIKSSGGNNGSIKFK